MGKLRTCRSREMLRRGRESGLGRDVILLTRTCEAGCNDDSKGDDENALFPYKLFEYRECA
jgi:hypothetical protein